MNSMLVQANTHGYWFGRTRWILGVILAFLITPYAYLLPIFATLMTVRALDYAESIFEQLVVMVPLVVLVGLPYGLIAGLMFFRNRFSWPLLVLLWLLYGLALYIPFTPIGRFE